MATGLITVGQLVVAGRGFAVYRGRLQRLAGGPAVARRSLLCRQAGGAEPHPALGFPGDDCIYGNGRPDVLSIQSASSHSHRQRCRRPHRSSSMCPAACCPPATFTPSPTSAPSQTPIPTSDSNAHATAHVTPTATLPPNVPGILQTPVPSAVPAAPNAKLTFTTLASVVDSKGTPSDPGLAFPGGTRRVRLFFQAANVNNGAVWSVLCYKGNQLVDSVRRSMEMGTAHADCARLLRHRRLTGHLHSGRLSGARPNSLRSPSNCCRPRRLRFHAATP